MDSARRLIARAALAAALSGAAAGPALAQLSDVQAMAAVMGRAIGAATQCGISRSRLEDATKRGYTALDARGSAREYLEWMMEGIERGSREAASGRTSCADVREAFATLERSLARYPPKRL